MSSYFCGWKTHVSINWPGGNEMAEMREILYQSSQPCGWSVSAVLHLTPEMSWKWGHVYRDKNISRRAICPMSWPRVGKFTKSIESKMTQVAGGRLAAMWFSSLSLWLSMQVLSHVGFTRYLFTAHCTISSLPLLWLLNYYLWQCLQF